MEETVVHYLKDGSSTLEYEVGANTSFALILAATKPAKIDARVTVRLIGSGAQATIVGIIVGNKNADIHLTTLQRHEAPDTTSNLLVKSALSGDAKCIVDGAIRVEKDAQKTDAYQRNENILLSDTAYAESKPALEILANDVRCTHGATVGPISQEEVWFLASRGIPPKQAEQLIVEGFFNAALKIVADESVRYRILKDVRSAI